MHKCVDSNSDDFMSQQDRDIKELGDYYFNEDFEESRILEAS